LTASGIAAVRFSEFNHLMVEQREDVVLGGGIVRRYRLPNGYGLNGINTPLAHRFPYAWEFTVLDPDESHSSGFGDVTFDTPLTSSVVICRTERDAAAFLARAVAWAKSRDLAAICNRDIDVMRG
jgi:hypothetical protein